MSMPSRSSSSHPESSHPYRDMRVPINNFLANNSQHEEEVVDEPSHSEDTEGGPPTPTRRRTPVIPITTTDTPQYTPYVPRTPSPGTYARFAARVGGFEVGRDIRPVAPTTNYDTWGRQESNSTTRSRYCLSRLLGQCRYPLQRILPLSPSKLPRSPNATPGRLRLCMGSARAQGAGTRACTNRGTHRQYLCPHLPRTAKRLAKCQITRQVPAPSSSSISLAAARRPDHR